MTRLLAITLLLRELHTLDYSPPTWTGQLVARQSRPGEGPSTRMGCSSCHGQGTLRRRGIAHVCETCAGRGWLVVDAYTRRQVGTEETGLVQQVKALHCDACSGNGVFGNQRRCDRCSGSGWVEVPLQRLAAVRTPLSADADTFAGGDPVLACMDRRERSGDFEQLGLALGALRLELPGAYRTVVRVYVEALHEPEELDQLARLRHDVGLRYLARLMPDEIRVPSWAPRNERRRRERLRKRQREAAA